MLYFSNLVFIDKRLYNNESLFSLEYVVAHETAHQWWYGVVGNNEVRESWLDEGLTEYSTVLYYQERYGEQTAQKIFNQFIENPYKDFRKSQRDGNYRILTSLDGYNGWDEYFALAYCGGAIVFHRLRQELGDEKFFKALKVHYDTYKFENVTTGDFIKVIEDMGLTEAEGKIKEWLFEGY